MPRKYTVQSNIVMYLKASDICPSPRIFCLCFSAGWRVYQQH